MCYCPFTYNDSLVLDMFYIKMSCIFFFHKYRICGFLDIFCRNFSKQSKNSINFNSSVSINNNIHRLQIPVTPIYRTLKDGEILGSADCFEIDLNSDVNQPASGKLRKSTTVSSQCDILPYP